MEIEITIELKNCDYYANAIYNTESNTVTILKESKMRENEKPSIPVNAHIIREQLKKGGIVDQRGVFLGDYIMSSKRQTKTPLSVAAAVIMGRSANGLNEWKVNDDGKLVSIKDYLAKRGIHLSEEDDDTNAETKGQDFSNQDDGDDDSDDEAQGSEGAESEGNEPEGGDGTHDPSGESVPQSFTMPKQEISEKLKKYLHQNVIFYGVPGCGKSHFIDDLLSEKKEIVVGGRIEIKKQKMDERYYKRILFHPEYSYSDFVGQVMPTVGDKVTYEFEAGPFVEILADALADADHQYILIIEEINRGNAPAIFGDLFQLLDRNSDGESEYEIYNKAILNSKQFNELTPKPASVKIPSNLTILATMNTCDQNVFTLDTAFKRRWRMCRIKNNFDEFQYTAKIDKLPFNWPDFAKAANDDILDNCNDGTAAEDKLLGAFFVKEDDVKDVQRFAEKVLMYLWNDVVNYDRSRLFNVNSYKTLDQAIGGFVEGENVFSSNCTNLKKLYDDAKTKLEQAKSSETESASATTEENSPEETERIEETSAEKAEQGDKA